MKITRSLAKKMFKEEMVKYHNVFYNKCVQGNKIYSYEFTELIDVGLSYGIPTPLIHKFIQSELKRVCAEIIAEYNRNLEYRTSEMLRNYVVTPILTFSPQDEFLKYLDTVDYKTVSLSTVKTRGYCFGLTVPEIEAIVEEHRTRL